MQILRKQIEKYLKTKHKNAKLTNFEKLGKGVHGIGYLIEFKIGNKSKKLILKTLFPENFGHDYFSDRAGVLLLANYAYNLLPNHVKSVDVIGVGKEIVSVGNSKEFFILMESAKGKNYFSDLDRIKQSGIKNSDREKALKLSNYLVKVHRKKFANPILYKRKIRDTIGHGECIMGIIDTYPKVDFTNEKEMTEIAVKCVKWWGKIKNYSHRLSIVHGDFHPGNIWWDKNNFVLLDRSRGIYGEPSDDVSTLSINYLFYSLMQRGNFSGDFSELFNLFFENYLNKTNDDEMLKVIAPFYAFRVLVIANPLFYPNVSNEVRRKLFNFAQNILDREEFDTKKIDKWL